MTASSSVETSNVQSFVLGGEPVTDSETILSGQDLAQFSVVGRVTASGKFILSNSGAADGSENPVGITLEAVDATGGDETAPLYKGGEFDLDQCIFHASFSTDLLKKAAFDRTAIVLKKRG